MVYFIEAVGAGLVKIGFTDGDPLDRLKQLQTGCPHMLRLRATVAGGLDTEKEYHTKFIHHRASGEWFKLAMEIEVFIGLANWVLPELTRVRIDLGRLIEGVANDLDCATAGYDYLNRHYRKFINDIHSHLGLPCAFGEEQE